MAVFFAAGCGAPVGPTEVAISPGPPLAAKPEALYPHPVDFLAGLPAERAAVSVGRALYRLGDSGGPVALGTDAGALHDLLVIGRSPAMGGGAGSTGAGGILVGGDAGLFAIVAGILERSPIAAALDGAAVLRLLDAGADGAPRVFILTAQHLYLWQDGAARAITFTDGPDLPRSRYAARPAAGDAAGVLFIAPPPDAAIPALFALTLQANDVTASRIALDAPPADLAVDDLGTLWIALADGRVLSLAGDGTRAIFRLPAQARRLLCDRGSADLWLLTDDGPWHERHGAFAPLDTSGDAFAALGAAAPDHVAADLGGALLLAGPGGAARVRPDTDLVLAGQQPSVMAPLTITVGAPFPDRIRGLTADLDGTAQWADLPTRTVVVDPWSVPPGPHTLAVSVAYDAGAPLAATAKLEIVKPAAPTWTTDIQPIFQSRCSRCHAPGGSAHTMATVDAWQAQIDKILSALDDRRMPLPPNPPLPGAQVVAIRGWHVTGLLP